MLLAEGIAVVGLSRHPEIEGAEPGYFPLRCDLSKVGQLGASLDTVFAEHAGVDLVINNAGFGILGELPEISNEAIERQYAVMLVAPALICRKALEVFSERIETGCLVNVSSLATELPIPLMPVYNSCKAGLSGLSDSLILDLSGSKKSAVVIDFRPGDFCTEFSERMEGAHQWNGVDLRQIMDRHHAKAPKPEIAVEALRKALRRGKSGRVRTGDFFQSKIAPLGPRLFPHKWLTRIIRGYYSR
jgi:short-subunit dehydrogenase